MVIRRWSDVSPDELTLENIQRQYSPARAFRISKNSNAAGTTFPGAMRPGVCYVLEGACNYTFDESFSVEAGQIVDLPGGSFTFSAQGDQPVVVVLVWKLPPEFVPAKVS